MYTAETLRAMAVPVAGALATYEPEEAVLFGVLFGIAIGRLNAQVGERFTEVGLTILSTAEGGDPEDADAYRADFDSKMVEISEALTVLID